MKNENTSLQKSSQESNLPAVFNFFDPSQFEVMQRVSKMFANSDLVPDMYKVSDKNPLDKAMANCMIALDMSSRNGASPLMIMQNMVIIYGRPSWSSKFLIATVNTCGRFDTLKFKFTNHGKIGKFEYTEYEKKWEQGANGSKGRYVITPKKVTFDGTNVENIECIAYTSPKGSDDIIESSPVSVKMAIEERWYTKEGSKWQTMTRQMLMYRAASFWTSAYAPELSMGMKTVEEIIDIEDIEYEDVTTKIAKKANKNTVDFEAVKEEETKPEEVPTMPPPSAPGTDEKPEPTQEENKEVATGAPKLDF